MDEEAIQNGQDAGTLDDLVNALGGTTDVTPADQDGNQNTNQDDGQANNQTDVDTNKAPNTEQTTNSNTNQQPNKTDAKPNKINDAFARLRTQNAQYEKTLKGVATVLGIDAKDVNTEDLLKVLQDKVVNEQAKQQNVPPELLKRLNSLEQDKQDRELRDLRTQAFLGFQRVKDKFNLTDDALQDFASELQLDGINPFETPINLETAYIQKHFNDLIAAAKEQGIQEEQARANKASTNSSTPATKRGAEDNKDSSENIKTVADLTKWFNEQGGK